MLLLRNFWAYREKYTFLEKKIWDFTVKQSILRDLLYLQQTKIYPQTQKMQNSGSGEFFLVLLSKLYLLTVLSILLNFRLQILLRGRKHQLDSV